MALRNQPYLPLYVDDFLADEKLSMCSAESTGVYIRLMCLMHKADEYGAILLKQIEKQSAKQVENFACRFARQMPYTSDVILSALNELLAWEVIEIDGDRLVQRRMVRDGNLSEIRASAGKRGGQNTQKKAKTFASDFAKAKVEANAVIVNENVNENISNKESKSTKFIPPSLEDITSYCAERKNDVDPKTFYDFFTEGNWIDSKGNPVKNWKQKVITWEKNSKPNQRTASNNPFLDMLEDTT